MRHAVIASLFLAGLTPAARAPRRVALDASAPSFRAERGCPRGPADEQALLRLEDDWATALVRRDAAVFRRLLAEGFVYTENDRMVNRDAVLQDVVAGPDTALAAHNDDMRVHCFGRTAAVTGWLIVRGRGAAGPFEHRYRFTDTWVDDRGRWQIVAAQDYLAPDKRT